jgi:hypothetical protein
MYLYLTIIADDDDDDGFCLKAEEAINVWRGCRLSSRSNYVLSDISIQCITNQRKSTDSHSIILMPSQTLPQLSIVPVENNVFQV